MGAPLPFRAWPHAATVDDGAPTSAHAATYSSPYLWLCFPGLILETELLRQLLEPGSSEDCRQQSLPTCIDISMTCQRREPEYYEALHTRSQIF